MEKLNQKRTTAAATGVQKPSGVPSSIFDAGRIAAAGRAKKIYKLLPPLDVAAVVIRSGVPMPTTASPYRAPLAKMLPGQSVELSAGHAKSLISHAKKAGIKVGMRRLGDDLIGVWRLAD